MSMMLTATLAPGDSMRARYRFAIALSLFGLAGCIQTQEMPLAPNVVRLDTHASGLLFTGQTVPQTMHRAAEATLHAGYSRFKFADASSAQGSRLVGVYSSASAQSNTTGTVSGYGNFASVNANTSTTADASSVPVYQNTSDIGVTVIMLKPGDPGFATAFDAQAVLAQYPK
jgi:hypothetical protein